MEGEKVKMLVLLSFFLFLPLVCVISELSTFSCGLFQEKATRVRLYLGLSASMLLDNSMMVWSGHCTCAQFRSTMRPMAGAGSKVPPKRLIRLATKHCVVIL